MKTLAEELQALSEGWRATGREWRDAGGACGEMVITLANEVDALLKRMSRLSERGNPLCVFCNTEIVSEHLGYRKVFGFEKHRSEGGLHALRVRTQTDEWACDACVERESKGVSAHQMEIA